MSIFLAMIKAVEDRLNVKIDTQASKDVQVLKYPKYPKPPFRLKRAKAPSVAAVLAGYAPEGKRMARMTDETNRPDAARSKRHSGACLAVRRCRTALEAAARGTGPTDGRQSLLSTGCSAAQRGSGAGDHPDRRQRAVLLVVLAAAVLRCVRHLLRGCCLLCRTARASSAYS